MAIMPRSFMLIAVLAIAAPSAAQTPAPAPKNATPAKAAPATAAPAPAPGAAPAAPAAVPAPAPGAATPATPPAKKLDLPSPPPNFEYAADGRRDPFISLENRGSTEGVKRADGVPGMMTNELTVRGIVLTRGEWVAMVSGPDSKVFTVRAGDKLADGTIQSISANSVVILQEVNDPLSLEKLREVRKFLRGGEEVK
jgi:Tfp pilus assembly protein PilP